MAYGCGGSSPPFRTNITMQKSPQFRGFFVPDDSLLCELKISRRLTWLQVLGEIQIPAGFLSSGGKQPPTVYARELIDIPNP